MQEVNLLCEVSGLGDHLLTLAIANQFRLDGFQVRLYIDVSDDCQGDRVRRNHALRGWTNCFNCCESAHFGQPQQPFLTPHRSPNFTREKSRWQNYAMACGIDRATLPEININDTMRQWGRQFDGAVVLAPMTHADLDRRWSMGKWLELERFLTEAGHRVIVMDDRRERIAMFRSEKFTSCIPGEVISLALASKCLIGIDSGPAHLWGLLKRDTIVIMVDNLRDGWKEFDLYPNVTLLGNGGEEVVAQCVAEHIV